MFWASITPADRQVIEEMGTRRRFPAGTVLFLDNDRSTSVLVLLDGQVKLSRSTLDGREIVIELRGPGNLLGELAAIDGGRRIATATTVTPVQALVLPADRFRQLLLDRPGICMAVLTLVVEKLRQATERRVVASSTYALGRLAGRLVELAAGRPAGDHGVIVIESLFTQQELAEWIGVSRDAVVIALRTMRAAGWISTGRRSIRIYDLEALHLAANQEAVPRKRRELSGESA